MNVSTEGPLYGGTLVPSGKTAGLGLGSYCLDKSQYWSKELRKVIQFLATKYAEFLPIAIVRPQPMYRPGILGQQLTLLLQAGVRVPELRLQHKSAFHNRATRILHDRGVLTGIFQGLGGAGCEVRESVYDGMVLLLLGAGDGGGDSAQKGYG